MSTEHKKIMKINTDRALTSQLSDVRNLYGDQTVRLCFQNVYLGKQIHKCWYVAKSKENSERLIQIFSKNLTVLLLWSYIYLIKTNEIEKKNMPVYLLPLAQNTCEFNI